MGDFLGHCDEPNDRIIDLSDQNTRQHDYIIYARPDPIIQQSSSFSYHLSPQIDGGTQYLDTQVFNQSFNLSPRKKKLRSYIEYPVSNSAIASRV